MRLRGEGWDIQSEVNRGHWFFFLFYSERNGTDWDPPPPASLPAACSLVRSLLLILNLSFAISSGRERREEREKELTFGVWRHLMDHQLMASSSIHRLPLLLPLPLPPVFQNHRPAYHLLFLSSSLCSSPVPSRPWPLRRRRRLYLHPPPPSDAAVSTKRNQVQNTTTTTIEQQQLIVDIPPFLWERGSRTHHPLLRSFSPFFFFFYSHQLTVWGMRREKVSIRLPCSCRQADPLLPYIIYPLLDRIECSLLLSTKKLLLLSFFLVWEGQRQRWMERNKRTDERTNERFTSFLPPLSFLSLTHPRTKTREGRQSYLTFIFPSRAHIHVVPVVFIIFIPTVAAAAKTRRDR